jgi:hypothetical protein
MAKMSESRIGVGFYVGKLKFLEFIWKGSVTKGDQAINLNECKCSNLVNNCFLGLGVQHNNYIGECYKSCNICAELYHQTHGNNNDSFGDEYRCNGFKIYPIVSSIYRNPDYTRYFIGLVGTDMISNQHPDNENIIPAQCCNICDELKEAFPEQSINAYLFRPTQ